jgi:hypothetical protein
MLYYVELVLKDEQSECADAIEVTIMKYIGRPIGSKLPSQYYLSLQTIKF